MAGNVTALSLGRSLLLKDGTHAVLLARTLASTTAAPPARQGAALALHNCALDAEQCSRLVDAAGDTLVPSLLRPLAPHSGDDEPLREACANAVASLAGSADGRRALWAAGAPELLRKAYEEEQAAGVCAIMEHAVRLGRVLLFVGASTVANLPQHCQAALLMSDGREADDLDTQSAGESGSGVVLHEL